MDPMSRVGHHDDACGRRLRAREVRQRVRVARAADDQMKLRSRRGRFDHPPEVLLAVIVKELTDRLQVEARSKLLPVAANVRSEPLGLGAVEASVDERLDELLARGE